MWISTATEKKDLDDSLGFVVHDNNHMNGFVASCDTPYFDKVNGEWSFVFGSERDADVCDKIVKLKEETVGVHFSQASNSNDKTGEYALLSDKFVGGSLFMISAEMGDINSLFRSIAAPYGILPFPKYDEAQKEYSGVSRNTQNAFSMTATCKNPDAAGAVMEALSCQNYNTVAPAYFETVLKMKYSDSPETAQMFDLIKGSTALTFWYTYGNSMGNPFHKVYQQCAFKNTTGGKVASVVASQKSSIESAMAKYLESYRNIGK